MLRIQAFLSAPAGKSIVQKLLITGHGAGDLNGAAVGHVQFHNDTATLQHIQLLAVDTIIAIGYTFLAESGYQKTIFVIINSKADEIYDQTNAHQ